MKKTILYSFAMLGLLTAFVACNKVSYNKTKSGILYKIFPGKNGKDSALKAGDWIKFNFEQKINDSVLATSFGKMPIYVKIESNMTDPTYNPSEILPLLKKGDSAVLIMMVDSLMKKGMMQPDQPGMKKGDRFTFRFRVLDVFRSDSLYQLDFAAEEAKDGPRRLKEQEEQMAKMKKDMLDQQEKDYQEHVKSGEADRGIKEMEAFLGMKGIKATKVGKGTFVVVEQQGTGASAGPGKYVTVKYDGKFMDKDSTFDAGEFTRELGAGQLISGMEEGLEAFKEGGKGWLYIPGFRAYGKSPNPGSPFKPFEPLRFKIELLRVSDTAISAGPPMPR